MKLSVTGIQILKTLKYWTGWVLKRTSFYKDAESGG